MRYAKIINGNIEYYIRPSHILGNCEPDAISNGFKPVIEQEGTQETFYETDFNIVIEHAPVIEPDWLYPDRPLRITVPVAMLFSSGTWIALWGYVQAMNIPSILSNGNRIIYLETFEPAHEAFILSQNIVIEEMPTS